LTQGLAWLFLGVANSDALLYDDELQVLTYCWYAWVLFVMNHHQNSKTLAFFFTNSFYITLSFSVRLSLILRTCKDDREGAPSAFQAGLRAESRTDKCTG
jgi:hypothetical protein